MFKSILIIITIKNKLTVHLSLLNSKEYKNIFGNKKKKNRIINFDLIKDLKILNCQVKGKTKI